MAVPTRLITGLVCRAIRTSRPLRLPRLSLTTAASPTPGPSGSSPADQSQLSSSTPPPLATLISTPTSSTSQDSPFNLKKPAGIRITPSVVDQIERVRKMDGKPDQVLRLSVESGGCHGFQYKVAFTDSVGPDDFLFTVGQRNGIVVVDESSLELMDGSTIDFATELIGSSFRILDNPRAAGKGCGCGVSWELK